jgi:hypothetical protein
MPTRGTVRLYPIPLSFRQDRSSRHGRTSALARDFRHHYAGLTPEGPAQPGLASSPRPRRPARLSSARRGQPACSDQREGDGRRRRTRLTPSRLDIGRTIIDRSRAAWPGAVADFRLLCGSLKASGANERGEPNGEPTSTGIRPHQATSSHSHRWWMPHQATYSHVQRRYVLAIQARGRRFEPCCAHCFRSSAACCDLERIVRGLTGSQLIVILPVAGAMSTPRVRAHPAILRGHLRPPVGCRW